jgi:hypothetical protein
MPRNVGPMTVRMAGIKLCQLTGFGVGSNRADAIGDGVVNGAGFLNNTKYPPAPARITIKIVNTILTNFFWFILSLIFTNKYCTRRG